MHYLTDIDEPNTSIIVSDVNHVWSNETLYLNKLFGFCTIFTLKHPIQDKGVWTSSIKRDPIYIEEAIH